jgi:hypothetical protein
MSRSPRYHRPRAAPGAGWDRSDAQSRDWRRINLLIFRSLREAAPFSYRVSFINCGSTRRVASAARSDFDIGKLSAGLIGDRVGGRLVKPRLALRRRIPGPLRVGRCPGTGKSLGRRLFCRRFNYSVASQPAFDCQAWHWLRGISTATPP